MTFLLNCVIQVTVILSIAVTSLPFLRKKSAALRHCVLSAAIVFSILTPAFNWVAPAWNWGALVKAGSQHPAVAPIREQIARVLTQPERTWDAAAVGNTANARSSERSRGFPRSLWMLWATGVFVGMFVLLTGLVRLAGVVSASVPMRDGRWRRLAALISSEYGLKSVVRLLESRNPSILITWGLIRPRVVLPAGSAEWPEGRVRIVLRHELAHIRRGDWMVQMIAQILRILYWFNPLVWIVCRRLRLESECACDDTVLADDIAGHEYAEHLLDLARILNRPGQSWSAALTMTRASTIERRFSAMLNPGLNRYPVTRFALFAMAFVGLAVSVFLSAVSTASPIHSVPAAAEKTLAAVSIEPQRTLTAAPAAIEPEAARPAAKQAQVEHVASAMSMLSVAPQNLALGGSSQRRGSALDRALFEAAEDGDVSDIEDLLRAGGNVNAAIAGDGTPLMGAASKGHLEAVRLLLERGADPNIPVAGDGNALIIAARAGHVAIVRLLLDRGADPNAAVLGDGNALIMAAGEGHADVVTLLLDRGASVDQVVPGDENPLITASGAGQLNVVRLLVSRRADVNARVWVEPTPWRPAGEWRTPLSEARKHGHQDVVQFLLSVGARE